MKQNWACLAREYLALRKKELLEQAIASAERVDEKEIASLLRARQENNIQFIEEYAPSLYRKLLAVGRSEEAWTVALLHQDMNALLAKDFIQSPLEQQAQALNIGIHACQQAAHISKILDDWACKAFYLHMVGYGYHQGSQLEIAVSAYQEALDIYRKLAENQPQVYKPYVAKTLFNQGIALSDLRQLEAAESACQEALTLYRKLAKEQQQVYEPYLAMTLNNLGAMLRDLRRFEAAKSVCQESLMLYRKLAEKSQTYEPDVARTLSNLGAMLRDLRQLEAAEAAYQEALTLYRKLRDEPGIAMTLIGLGAVLRGLRRLEGAKAAYQEALPLCRKLAEKQPQIYEPYVAATLNNMGILISDLRKVSGPLNNLGIMLGDLHKLEAEESAYREALDIYRKLAKNQPHIYEPYVAATLNNLGTVLKNLNRFDAAKVAYQEALMIRRKLAKVQPDVYQPDVATTLNNLGSVLRDLRQLEAAETFCREALKIYESRDIPDRMIMALSNLGQLLMESERWEESAKLLEKARDKVEQLRMEMLSLDRKMQIFREHIQIYDNLLVCLMKLGRTEDALVVAEASKSRTLVDLLCNIPGKEYNRMLIQARTLEYQINTLEYLQQYDAEISREDLARLTTKDGLQLPKNLLNMVMESADSINSTEILRKLVKLVDTSRTELVKIYSNLQGQVDTKDKPDFMSHTRSLNLQEILEVSKKAQSTLVLFRVTQRGSFVFLVFPDNKIDSLEVPEFTSKTLTDLLIGETRTDLLIGDQAKAIYGLDGWLAPYYYLLAAKGTEQKKKTHRAWLDTMDATLGKLYEQLLKRVHQHLKGKTTSLVIVPNRGLAILPLHACWWEDNGTRHYFLDEFIIRYAPSLSVFKQCLERERKGGSPGMLLGVANPDPPGDLVFSEWECKEIERILGSDHCSILWKDQATKKELMERTTRSCWQWLHFSCHGEYRLDAPLESAIYFTDGEALTLVEIFGMDLPEAWLVILSDCETGLVDCRDMADEHYGLPIGFLYAGAATVYSSLWRIPDDLSTAFLMRQVYEYLVKGIRSKPDALCKAQALNNAQRWLRDVTTGELDKIFALFSFSWDDIQRNDNRGLKEFLIHNFGLDWVNGAKIEEMDNGKTIKVSAKKKYLSLRLNDERTKISLQIDDGITDEFIAKMENDKLNIYRDQMTWTQIVLLRRGMIIYGPDYRPFTHPYWWAGFQHVGV